MDKSWKSILKTEKSYGTKKPQVHKTTKLQKSTKYLFYFNGKLIEVEWMDLYAGFLPSFSGLTLNVPFTTTGIETGTIFPRLSITSITEVITEGGVAIFGMLYTIISYY